MATLTFKYRSGSTVYSRTFTILAEKGLTDPDEVEIVGTQDEMSDGSLEETIEGFRRIVTVNLGVQSAAADRAFIFEWLRYPDRWIDNSPYASVVLALADPAGFENDWKDGSVYQRYHNLRLRETSIHQTWPEAIEPVETETLYISDWIEITGNEASPQTLTTNSGALATMADGNAWPAINLAAYTVTVLISERQGRAVHQVGAVTQSGANISWTVALKGSGNPYADGKFYANFTIGLQAI